MGITPAGRGPELMSVYAAFIGLTTVAISLRVYVRAFMVKNFGLDDWTACLGWLLFVFHASFAIAGGYHGTGQHMELIQPPSEIPIALKWWWTCEPLYVLANMAIKLSIGLMLLRIVVEKSHRMIVFVNLAVLETYSLAYFFVFIFQCIPSSFFWTRTAGDTNGMCMDTKVIVNMTYAFSALTCVVDWTFSILPWFVVRKLQMTQRTKLMVAIVLGLGSVASTATIVRTPYVATLENTADFLYATVDVAIWSSAETGLAIIASAGATLKPLFKEFLSRSKIFGDSSIRMTSQGWPKNTGGSYYRASSADRRDANLSKDNNITRTFQIDVSHSDRD